MREPDPFPDDPEVVATLEAIDATLAGEAIDPRHAGLAELALLLAADRPVIDPAFATVLDEGVQRRAGAAPSEVRRRARWWVWAPSAAVMASLAVAVVIVVGQGGGSSTSDVSLGAPNRAVASPAGGSSAGIPAAPKVAVHHAKGVNVPVRAYLPAQSPQVQAVFGANAHGSAQADKLPGAGSASWAAPVNGGGNFLGRTLAPPTAGRKVIQGAQVSLFTSSKRVDTVAQEVFDVVSQQKGIVKSSRVTASGGQGGYAQFQLSVPSGNLTQTMSALSSLPYARVVSRTDTSQDVTNQFDVDQRNLSDARALRASLLKQLAAAVTQAEIDSLTIRIHDAEGAITADENTLRSLDRQVGYSQIFVSINAGALPVPVHHGTSGFTLGKATHDAGKVLTVAAGVALIGLAALLPVGLVLALLWWIYSTLRRRRRLQALDLY